MKDVNVVYLDHKGGPVIHYEGPEGKAWICNKKRNGFNNVAMGYVSLRNPTENDALLILEPKCVLTPDYEINNIKKFNKIFTWATKAFEGTEVENRIIETNHPSCRDRPNIKQIKDNLNWNKRKNEIVFIANNKKSSHTSEIYSLRIKLADYLHKHSKYEVSWYGQSGLNKPYYKGKLKNKNVLKNAKFSICTENCYHPKFSHNYLSEKLPEVWFAGAVPLYMGCYNIDDFNFGPNSYIDLRKYVDKHGKDTHVHWDKLLDKIHSFNEKDYNQMGEELIDNLEKPDGLFHVISINRYYRTIINSYK